MNARQIDWVNPEMNGQFEEKTYLQLKRKESAKKAAATLAKNKKEKELQELRKFDKDHPEQLLFK